MYRQADINRPVKITNLLLNGKKMSFRMIYRAAALSHLPDGYFESAPFKIIQNAQKKIYKKQEGKLLFARGNNCPGKTRPKRSCRTEH